MQAAGDRERYMSAAYDESSIRVQRLEVELAEMQSAVHAQTIHSQGSQHQLAEKDAFLQTTLRQYLAEMNTETARQRNDEEEKVLSLRQEAGAHESSLRNELAKQAGAHESSMRNELAIAQRQLKEEMNKVGELTLMQQNIQNTLASVNRIFMLSW